MHKQFINPFNTKDVTNRITNDWWCRKKIRLEMNHLLAIWSRDWKDIPLPGSTAF